MGKINKSTEGQRALIAAYEAIQDQLPPASSWNPWVKLGEQAERRMSYLKSLWSWKR